MFGMPVVCRQSGSESVQVPNDSSRYKDRYIICQWQSLRICEMDIVVCVVSIFSGSGSRFFLRTRKQ